jgi:asparagine N-glycosylation enzyme membrane subunit Stt3
MDSCSAVEPLTPDLCCGRWGRRLFLLFIIALGIRLIFLFIADNNGTDAYIRYKLAASWLEKPVALPSDVWLPLHFWLLAGALSVWNSEFTVRFVTVVLGALTVFPVGGIGRRLFNDFVGFYWALTLAIFGFHVAYSVTSSSEVPTLFF